MAGPPVIVVPTGAANLASVCAGLRRAGADPQVTDDPAPVAAAERLVLPGVGAFGPAMQRLRAAGLADLLAQRVRDGRPTLAVCLGLQLLCENSAESPGVPGLAVLPRPVTRFSDAPRCPQMGWNWIAAPADACLLRSGHTYFANSYCLTEPPPGWSAAMANHGHPFVAALERGAVLACQFHPELSGSWGLDLLRRWLAQENEPAPPATDRARTPARLAHRVIPCLDCRDGRVVKGVRFAGLRDAGSPTELAAAYEAQGADELVLLDVSATPEGRSTHVATVQAVRQCLSIPLTVGGGVRCLEDAAALLDAGADKVGINTAAVADPELITRLADRFGRQCTILAVDAAARPDGGWEVVILSGRQRPGLDALAWCREGAECGAGEILLTSWDRDGTRGGYDLDLLAAVAGIVSVPVIASGGAAEPAHLVAALRAGADAVLAASIFHYGEYTIAAVKRSLAAEGLEVRP